MKSLFTTTAVSAFLLTGAAFAQDETAQDSNQEGQVTEVEEFVEPGAEQPVPVSKLEQNELDEVEDAETLNKVVLDATTQAGDGEVIVGDGEQRRQVTADSSTTPDQPSQSDAQRRQEVAINNLIEETGGQTQVASASSSATSTADADTDSDTQTTASAETDTDMDTESYAQTGTDDVDLDTEDMTTGDQVIGEERYAQDDATTSGSMDMDEEDDGIFTTDTETAMTAETEGEYDPEITTDTDEEVTTASTFDAEDDMMDVEDTGVTTTATLDEQDDDLGLDTEEPDGVYALTNTAEPTGIILYEEDQILGTQRLASSLIGEDIEGADGDEIAEITDFVVDQNGNVTDAVISAGGILGLGKKTYTVAFNELSFMEEDDGEVEISSNLTKDNVKNLTQWSRDEFAIGEGGQTLASELRNAELALMGSDETVTVNDVLMNETGQVDGIIVAYDDEEYQVGYDTIMVAEGDAEAASGYRLDYAPTDFQNAQSGPMNAQDPMQPQDDSYGNTPSMDTMDDEPYGTDMDERDEPMGENTMYPADEDEGYEAATEDDMMDMETEEDPSAYDEEQDAEDIPPMTDEEDGGNR